MWGISLCSLWFKEVHSPWSCESLFMLLLVWKSERVAEECRMLKECFSAPNLPRLTPSPIFGLVHQSPSIPQHPAEYSSHGISSPFLGRHFKMLAWMWLARGPVSMLYKSVSPKMCHCVHFVKFHLPFPFFPLHIRNTSRLTLYCRSWRQGSWRQR